MKVAALDLGSNTFLLLIAEVKDHQIQRVDLDEARVVRLGQGVNESHRFHPDALERVEQCFAEFADLIGRHQVEKVVAVATSAARDVENRDDFLKLGNKYGIPIQVVSGDKEAEITFKGAVSDRDDFRTAAVIDVGGGSTEVIWGTSERIEGQSVDVGSVRLTEMFVSQHPIVDHELSELLTYASDKLSVIQPKNQTLDEVIAVAGTPTSLACVIEGREFSEDWVNGYKLSLATLQDWIKRLAAMTIEERQTLKGMPPKRADVIVAGAGILVSAMQALGQTEVRVSTRGVRYGVAMQAEELSQKT